MFRTFRPLKVEKSCFHSSDSGDLPFCCPHVTLRTVLFRWLWRTGGVEPWSALGLRLSIGSAVLRYHERLHDLCVTEGVFHPWESEPQGEGLYCADACACTRPVEFYRRKQVKTARGVSLFLSHFRSVAFFQEAVTVPWNECFSFWVGIPSVKPF